MGQLHGDMSAPKRFTGAPLGPWHTTGRQCVPRRAPGASQVSLGGSQDIPTGSLEGPQDVVRGSLGSPGGPKGSQEWAHRVSKYVQGLLGTCVQCTSVMSIRTPNIETENPATASWGPGRSQAVRMWLMTRFGAWERGWGISCRFHRISLDSDG